MKYAPRSPASSFCFRNLAIAAGVSVLLSACGGGENALPNDANTTSSQPIAPISTPTGSPAAQPSQTIDISVVGWPGLSALTLKVDGVVSALDSSGKLSVKASSELTFEVAGVELAKIRPKKKISIFDLLPAHDCTSSAELGKLTSLLLSLDADQDPSNGVQIPDAISQAASGTKLSMLGEDDLVALEKRLVNRSMPINVSLRAASKLLDQETWTEDVARRTLFNNDMSVLQSYLDRVLSVLTSTPGNLAGFAYISNDEAAKIPATLKGQGLAFDEETAVFSWRYGLQRTNTDYNATLTQALALPTEIQAEYAANASGVHMGHIGDIDILKGKLYAPIEDEDDSSQQSYVAVYDAKTLIYTGIKYALPRAEHADGVPWIAVDGPRGLAYTVTWSTSAASKLNVFDLANFKLLRSVPLEVSFDGKRVQGAKVFNGMLYASADTKDSVSGSTLKRKRIYKVDPRSGAVMELLHYDEPNRTEGEGLAFSPDGRLHLAVLAPYTTPLYAQSTTNSKPFDDTYSIDGDDWNPSGSLRHFSRTSIPLREQLCSL
ncbi:hypothetical protein [Variovorax ginsengisoli]|uniref:Uncharacterized protein n=1 Tax=Variovorax ginsengisoli TaxID=363844 RepID=A0ABT9S7K2_9BURK|nr:hypothetical protein [Variovorax ginsengisoli]MDP9899342.1 hypothetical protein [Variovorax ginsengisoli]